jgi:hypothetical protein
MLKKCVSTNKEASVFGILIVLQLTNNILLYLYFCIIDGYH